MTTPVRSGSEHISHYSSEDVNRRKDGTQKYHHHFHGAHNRAEEKKRLKKLVHQLENTLGSRQEQESGKPASKSHHHQRMLRNRLRDGINTVKKQFGLHDDKPENSAGGRSGGSVKGKGLHQKMLNYRLGSGAKDKFKHHRHSADKPVDDKYGNYSYSDDGSEFSSAPAEEDVSTLLSSGKEDGAPHTGKQKGSGNAHSDSKRGNSGRLENSAADSEDFEVTSGTGNAGGEEAEKSGHKSGGHPLNLKNGYGNGSANTNNRNSGATEALNIGNALVGNAVLSGKEKEKEKEKQKVKNKRNHSVKSGSKTSDSGHVDNITDADGALAAQGDIVLSGGISVLYLFMNLLSDLARYKYVEMQEKAQVSREAQDMANRVNEQIAELAKRKDSDSATVQLDPDVIKYMEDKDVEVDGKSIDDYLESSGTTPTNMTLKSADGKYTVNVYQKDGQWYIRSQNQDGSEFGTPQKTDAPTFKDGKISFTTKDDYSSDGVNIPKGTEFNGSYDPGTQYRALNKGELNAVKSALENESNRASDFVSQSQLQLQKVMQTYNVTVSLINSMQTLLEEMNKSIAQNIR